MPPTPQVAEREPRSAAWLRLIIFVALLGLVLGSSIISAQARVTPPKLYPWSASQGSVSLDCVRVNDRGFYYCNGRYAAPLTDAKVVRSFTGGATVTYYHQAVSCQPTTSSYGRWACSWTLT